MINTPKSRKRLKNAYRTDLIIHSLNRNLFRIVFIINEIATQIKSKRYRFI